MGGWRGEYTTSEWIQIVACLIGTPLASFLGVWFSRNRESHAPIVRSMLRGLATAAVVSVLFFAPFLIFAMAFAFRREASGALLQLFDDLFGVSLAATAVVIAAGGSMYAAQETLRRREAKPSASTISLRQLFLLQLFPFIVLGCWTGMRFTALSMVSEFQRAARKWTAREWQLMADEQGKPATLRFAKEFDYGGRNVRNSDFDEASREKWLQRLDFECSDDPDWLKFSYFAKTPSLKQLTIRYKYAPSLKPVHLSDLGEIKSLETLTLNSLVADCAGLRPLATLPHLHSLEMEGIVISPADLNQLADTTSIQSLTLHELSVTDLKPIQFPKSVTELSLQTRFLWTLDPEHFRRMEKLRRLSMHVSGITRAEIGAIAKAPRLEYLDLHGVTDPTDLELLMSTTTLKHLRFAYTPVLNSGDSNCKDLFDKLSLHPNLEVVECDPKFLMLWGSFDEEINLAESVTQGLDGARSIRMGPDGMKSLVDRRIPRFQAMIDDVRKSQPLGKLEVKFFPFSTSSIVFSERKAYQKRAGRRLIQ